MDRFAGMSEGLHKAKSGLIRALIKVEDNRLTDVVIGGDFILVPEYYIDRMEKALIGAEASNREISKRLEVFFENESFQSPATGPDDFARAFAAALEAQNG